MVSDTQKIIAKSLFGKSKTFEELQKELGGKAPDLLNELQGMLKLGLISKEGYPTKYILSKQITAKLGERKQLGEKDPHEIRLNIIIESKSTSQKMALESLKTIEKNLRESKEFFVYEVSYSEVKEEAEHYSAFMEVNLSVKDFKAITHLVFLYGPSVIEVLKPSKIELRLHDLQDALIDMSTMVQHYVDMAVKNMTKKELIEFNNSMLKGLKP